MIRLLLPDNGNPVKLNMFSKKKQQTIKEIPSLFLLSAERQSSSFQPINIEYFCLYYNVQNVVTKQAILSGLTNNLIDTSANLKRKATQWEKEHKIILGNLALKLTIDLKRRQRQLPVNALRRFSLDTKDLEEILTKTPNDQLCHFHLAWLHSIAHNYSLAETHFNIAALQSQNINPEFSCFAYRHLADVRIKSGKLPLALLAIEAACSQSQIYNPELQFERISLLSRANRTTQALPHMANLIKKDSNYGTLASQDVNILKNPSFKRFFDQEKEKHVNNIQRQVIQHWKNDPLHLLDLDKELGQKNSRKIILKKQSELLSKLSPLMIYNEELSSQLIQKSSRTIIINSLNRRKQEYIKRIEKHQHRANKAHNTGQWMLYIAIIGLVSLGLSYAVSGLAYQFNYNLPVNLLVQTLILSSSIVFAFIGFIFLHFTPIKLTDLLRQKQRLDTLSLRLGLSS